MHFPPVRFGESYRLSYQEGSGPVKRSKRDFYSDLVGEAGSLKDFVSPDFLERAARMELAQRALVNQLNDSGVKSTLALVTDESLSGNFLLTNGPKIASANQHLEILKKLNIDHTAPVTGDNFFQALTDAVREERALIDEKVCAPDSPELVVQYHINDQNRVVVNNFNDIMNRVTAASP